MKKLFLMSLIALSVLGALGQTQYTLPLTLPLGSEEVVDSFVRRAVVYGTGAIQNSNWTQSFPYEQFKTPVPRLEGESPEDLMQRIAILEAQKAVTNITNFAQTFRVSVFLKEASGNAVFHTINSQEEIVFNQTQTGWEAPSSVDLTLRRMEPTRVPVYVQGIKKAHMKVVDENGQVIFDQDAPLITTSTDRDWGIRKASNRLLLPVELITKGYTGEVTLTLNDGQIGTYDLQTGKRTFPPIPIKQEARFENGQIIVKITGAPGLSVSIQQYSSVDKMADTNCAPDVSGYVVLDRDGKGTYVMDATNGTGGFTRIVVDE